MRHPHQYQWSVRDARRAGSPPRPARGAVLLEVLVSLALLIFGLAVVGLQVNKGLDAALQAEAGTKAVMLADTKMAELLSGVVQPEANNDELKGDFGLIYPGYTWRFQFKPTDIPDFLMVTLEIGYSALQAKSQTAHPEQDIEFDDPDVQVVETAYRLLPIPADVNLERDFGLTQEELDKLNEIASGQQVGAQGNAIQGGPADAPAGGGPVAGGGGGGVGGGGQPPGLAELLELAGPFLQGNFDPRMLASLPPDTLTQLQPMLQGLLGRSSVGAQGPPDARELARQVFGGRRGGRRGGRDRGGDRGDRNGSDARGSDRDSGRNDGDDSGGRRGTRERDDNDGDARGGRGRDDDGDSRGFRGRDRGDGRDPADNGRGGSNRDGRDDSDNRTRGGSNSRDGGERGGRDNGERGGDNRTPRGNSRTTR